MMLIDDISPQAKTKRVGNQHILESRSVTQYILDDSEKLNLMYLDGEDVKISSSSSQINRVTLDYLPQAMSLLKCPQSPPLIATNKLSWEFKALQCIMKKKTLIESKLSEGQLSRCTWRRSSLCYRVHVFQCCPCLSQYVLPL